jgi:hypothetical protein
VTEAIEGDNPGAMVGIPYADIRTSPRSRHAVAHAWDHVSFSASGPVIAVITKRRIGDFQPGDPILVTSYAREILMIPAVLAEEARLQSLDSLASAVASLDSHSNPALAGYLSAHIWYRYANLEPELASRLFVQLIGGATVPPETWQEMTASIVLYYSLVSPDIQTLIVQRFVELALRPDRFAGFAGFHGLGQIATFASLEVVTAGLVDTLTKAYRRLVTVEGMQREFSLEAAFSIVLQ